MGHALVLCACYASMCFGGRWVMKDRKPFDLRMYVTAEERQQLARERGIER